MIIYTAPDKGPSATNRLQKRGRAVCTLFNEILTGNVVLTALEKGMKEFTTKKLSRKIKFVGAFGELEENRRKYIRG